MVDLTHAEEQAEQHVRIGGFLKEAVFGFNDGLVSTFAVIAGLTGGDIELTTVLLGALATLVAGGFSMGLGTYLGSKAEREHYESEMRREIYEMEHMPEAETEEIREIYAAKGFEGKLLEDVVAKITSDKKVWLKTMMTEELGFADEPPKPGHNGIIMSVSFIVGSAIPTIPYLFHSLDKKMFMGLPLLFMLSLVVSVIALLTAGILKTKFTKRNPLLSAFETLGIGVLAALGSYGTGLLLA